MIRLQIKRIQGFNRYKEVVYQLIWDESKNALTNSFLFYEQSTLGRFHLNQCVKDDGLDIWEAKSTCSSV